MSERASESSPPLAPVHPLAASASLRREPADISPRNIHTDDKAAPGATGSQDTAPAPGSLSALFGHYAETNRAVHKSEPVPSEIQAKVERATGADLSGVEIHTGTDANRRAAAHGAKAFAVGSDIYFGEGQYRPGTAEGDWLLAHELAHTIQQRSLGRVGLQAKMEVGAAYDETEAEADRVADHAIQGKKYPKALTTTSTAKIQRFAPDGHRRAGAEGLKESFSAEEIGMIYQSNWERDFSQASPIIADLVLSWKQVKHSYFINSGKIDPALSGQFRSSLWAVLDMNTEMFDESMGGYYPWQHMDHPGKKEAKQAEKRMQNQTHTMPAYLDENINYVLDLMTRAVDQYWKSEGRKENPISEWHFVSNEILNPKDRGAGNPQISREIISQESTDYAKSIGAQSKPLAMNKHGQPLMKASADFLGRAMHCIEDFFSHTNWIDLAQKVIQNQTINPRDIESGTFGLPDKCHALGHKLVSLSDSLLNDFDILLQSFHRKTEYKPNKLESASLQMDLLPLKINSLTPLGEMGDILASATALEADVRSGFLSMEAIFCNRSVLEQIRQKGYRLIDEGTSESSAHGHGKMAKDQPEAGKDYSTAHRLAVRANALIIAPLRQAMVNADSNEGAQTLAKQLSVARNVLAPPSKNHPLLPLVTKQ